MTTKLTQRERDAKIVGDALAEVLPPLKQWWWQESHLLKLNLLLIIPLLSSSVSGFDGSLMNGLQALPQWTSDFNDPQGKILGLVNGVMTIGNFLALPFVPWVSDKYGRKVSIVIGCVGTIIATVIQVVAVNYALFVFSRGLLGFASSFMIAPSAMLIAELSYPTHRGKYTSAYFTVYYLGAIVASWVTFGTQKMTGSMAWKVPSIFQAVLPLVQLLGIWFVPQSPRWLVAQDRVSEAAEILRALHDPTPGSPLVAAEMAEIIESIQMEKEAEQTTWSALFSTPGNRKRSLVAIIVGLFAQWNGVSVLSYYLAKVLSSVGIKSTFNQTLINGMLQIFNFLAALMGAFLVDRLGRRTLFLWSTAGMLGSYIVWTACSAVNNETGNGAAGIVVVVCVFVVFFHYDIAWTPLLFGYPTEIFPYSLRAKGISLEFFFNSGGLIIAQFVNPVAMEDLNWRYYIVFTCILVVLLGLIYFLFPETKGRTLEEIAVIFDGQSAETSVARETTEKMLAVEQVEKTGDA